MKRKQLFMIALIVSIFITLQPYMMAEEQGYCGVESSQQPQAINLAAYGTVKALLIFIDFSDDNIDVNNPMWPVGQGPNFLSRIGDQKYENVFQFCCLPVSRCNDTDSPCPAALPT